MSLDKTVCELFAGVGGFRVGLERADSAWKTVWANQWEPSRKRQDAFACYCSHFGGYKNNYINKDINLINKEEIPNHNLLVGGFPCQDYSIATTKAQGIKGKKGNLWWQIYEILEKKRPAFVLLENVDRLLKSPTSQRGRDFALILTSFWKFKYSVEWRVINAADYGFIQRRRRIFIFAYRNDTEFGEKQKRKIPSKIISDDGFFANTFRVRKYDSINKKQLFSQNLMEIFNDFSFSFESAGHMTNGSIVTSKVEPIYHGKHAILRDVMSHNIDEKYFLSDNISRWEYLKGAKHEKRIAKNGYEYFYSEGAIPFPDSTDEPARTILTSEASVNRSTHIVADLDNGKYRLLTPDEVDLIQGFPKGWTNTGMSERFRYFCMGNAVVIGVVYKMGKTLNKIFSGQDIEK